MDREIASLYGSCIGYAVRNTIEKLKRENRLEPVHDMEIAQKISNVFDDIKQRHPEVERKITSDDELAAIFSESIFAALGDERARFYTPTEETASSNL